MEKKNKEDINNSFEEKIIEYDQRIEGNNVNNNFNNKNNILASELKAYINSPYSPYYEHAVEGYLESNTRMFTWNWASFFFGVYWFLYRKSFVPALVFFSIYIAITTFFEGNMVIVPLIIYYLAMGFLGTTLYLNGVSTKIENIKSKLSFESVKDKMFLLTKLGGTTLMFPAIGYIFEKLFYMLMY